MRKANWIKLAVISLVIVVVLSLLATSWGATAKKFTDDGKPYEVSWFWVGDPLADQDSVSAEASKFLAKKIPNTKVKFTIYDWGTWFNRIPAMIAASEQFDILFVADWMKHWDYANQGALLPLNDLMKQYAPKTMKEVGELRIKGPQIDGINYGVPVKKDLATQPGFLFNKALLEKYKFDLKTLKNPEDIEPWLAIVHKNEPDITAFDPTHMGLTHFCEFRRPAGEWVPGSLTVTDKTKGKFFNQLKDPSLKRYSEIVYKWAQAGYIRDDAGTAGEQEGQRRQNGLVFCRVDPLKPGKDAEESNEKVTYIQKGFTTPYIANDQTGGVLYSISVTSKNPVRCMKVLELANTDRDFCNLITFGIEGKHYTKVGANYVKRIPNSGWAPYVWITCNQYLQYLQEGESPDKWKKMQEFDNSAVGTPDLGFRYQKDAMSTEINALQESIANQYSGPLINGRLDPAEILPEWIQQAQDAGGDAVLADLQKQFDAWKKANAKKK